SAARDQLSPAALSIGMVFARFWTFSRAPRKGHVMPRRNLHTCIAVTGLVTAAWCGAAFAQQSGMSSDQRSDQQSQRPTPSNMARSNQGGKNDASDKLAHKDKSF